MAIAMVIRCGTKLRVYTTKLIEACDEEFVYALATRVVQSWLGVEEAPNVELLGYYIKGSRVSEFEVRFTGTQGDRTRETFYVDYAEILL